MEMVAFVERLSLLNLQCNLPLDLSPTLFGNSGGVDLNWFCVRMSTIYGDNFEISVQSNQNVHAEHGGEGARDCRLNGISNLVFGKVVLLQEITGNHGRLPVLRICAILTA